MIYDVSPARLLHLLVEERLASVAELPTSAATSSLVTQELDAGRWYEALTLAVHGSRQAAGPSDRIIWDVHRALAMRKLGMRSDAVSRACTALDDGRAPHFWKKCARHRPYVQARTPNVEAFELLLRSDGAR